MSSAATSQAQTEFETPERREELLSRFKELIQSETDLEFPENDSEFLLRFLRVAKYDLKKAFDRLKRYYKTRQQYRADYEITKPSVLLPKLKQNTVGILRVPDGSGCTVIYFKVSNWHPATCSIEEYVNIFVLLLEKAVDELDTQISGIKLVADLNGFNLSHLTAVNFGTLVKCAKLLSGAVPIRMKGIHFINAPKIFNALYYAFKILFPEKLRKRLTLHSDVESVYKHVSRECLPTDVGGSQPEFDNSANIKELLDWEPTWEKYMTYGNKQSEHQANS